jgi:alpha-beta hydrolase superfamily lysophospholipase
VTELAYERALREWMDEQGMQHERLVYTRPAAGGDTVAYRLRPADETCGLILVAHGAGNDAIFAFPGLFKRFLKRRFEVFTFDLDGHGRYSTTHFAYPGVCSALAEAAQHAREGRSGLPMHAFGLSLGGSILLHALASSLPEVASAVLVSAPLRIEFSLRRVLHELRPSLLRTVWREREHAGLWGMVPSFGPVKRGLYPLRLAQPSQGAFGYVGALNRALEHMRLLDAASRVRRPTLLVYGTKDRIVPPEQGFALARAAPTSELLLVRGGTHLNTVFERVATQRTLEWFEGSGQRVTAAGRSG